MSEVAVADLVREAGASCCSHTDQAIVLVVWPVGRCDARAPGRQGGATGLHTHARCCQSSRNDQIHSLADPM